MALTDGTGGDMVMPVAPMYGGGNGGFGNNWGGDWAWIILLLLLAGNGWGGGFGGFGGMGGFAADGAALYPWMNQAEITNQGFQTQLLNDNITSIRDGVTGISTQLCNGFAGVNATINGGFANAETAANARQMANMQQAFGAQTSMAQGFNQLGSQFADCCCENRLGLADLRYTVATENCADRAAINDGVRDILANQNAGIQKILDVMCQDKIDAKNDTISQLRSELMYARGQASQDVQTAAIQAGQRALANEIEQYVLPTPRPAYIVQNPNCCAQSFGCGCGCGVA